MYSHDIPERNRANIPDEATKIEVPKSGCLAINNVGMITISNAINALFNLIGRVYWLIKYATAKGH